MDGIAWAECTLRSIQPKMEYPSPTLLRGPSLVLAHLPGDIWKRTLPLQSCTCIAHSMQTKPSKIHASMCWMMKTTSNRVLITVKGINTTPAMHRAEAPAAKACKGSKVFFAFGKMMLFMTSSEVKYKATPGTHLHNDWSVREKHLFNLVQAMCVFRRQYWD